MFIQNSCIFIQENVFENVVCRMSAMSRPQLVNEGRSHESFKGAGWILSSLIAMFLTGVYHIWTYHIHGHQCHTRYLYSVFGINKIKYQSAHVYGIVQGNVTNNVKERKFLSTWYFFRDISLSIVPATLP